MAMNMKIKFDKYWGSLEKMNKLMFVAMVIDPRYILIVYMTYKSQHNPSTQIGHSTDDLKQSNNVTMEVENDEEIDLWITFCVLREEESSMEVENDLTSYLSGKNVVDKEEFDIMYWWKMNGYKYPILSTIVLDVLVVPISMVASESVFSIGGRILDSFCSSLTPKTVETLIYTQNWIRGGSMLLGLHPQLEELETYENIEIGNPSSSIILD
ncbi:zinc finger BED domain-containing protein RICESLEEPER 3-like [Cucumis melo var. makuwa]|uniref:Zinc finger BED domain-containing protein RICESLEEPER 3-like n=1 Tax=Cucumis melo var. makuwa TaxID=1194695 RepID=A0A5D3BRI9_CUCMM|nr:zinc finger BED domain-containing protein RICESLEEPER 3-like [Cucumis melo var. makuwa]TYK02351.1 zinc finger BED domain-containing protein RICESLEEPER 3-like [Cucumis melo var. makuwa]